MSFWFQLSFDPASFTCLATIDEYKLLETLNNASIQRYENMKPLSQTVASTLDQLNDKCTKVSKSTNPPHL